LVLTARPNYPIKATATVEAGVKTPAHEAAPAEKKEPAAEPAAPHTREHAAPKAEVSQPLPATVAHAGKAGR
jgi:hypothetical protein